MYGLVNKGIYDLIVKNYGQDTWEKIAQKAGIEEVLFVNMKPYDDRITYDLVSAASEILAIPANDILIEFGKYWVQYTAKAGYGDLLNMMGKTFPEFINNLNNLHMRVGHMLKEFKPPAITCKEIDHENFCIEYHSEREGLAPLMTGLIFGLGDMFGKKLKVEHVKGKAELGHDEFHVSYLP